MIRLSLFLLVVLCLSFNLHAGPLAKSTKPFIYNEQTLNQRLKGKTKEEVLKVLGNPAVKKPCEECNENLEYWWYNLPEVPIFVHFRDGKVYLIRVVTEEERSKEL